MSLADRLEQANTGLKYKLFDNQISLMGKRSKVIRLKLNENKYGDGEIQIISKDEIECIIDYPGKIPLTRGRSNSAFVETTTSENIYLFDIIPITIITKWKDKVEKNDLIIDKIKDENGNFTTMLLMISELVGTFRNSLQYREGQCAPYNGGNITPEIQRQIDIFKT